MTKLEGIFLRQEPEALLSTVAAKSNYFDNTDRKNHYSWSNTQSGEGGKSSMQGIHQIKDIKEKNVKHVHLSIKGQYR